jgi:hypothetical protein
MSTIAADPNNPPEIVEQYLRSGKTLEGIPIRRNEKPFARVLAVRQPSNGAPSSEWTPEKNRRRCALVDLEIEGVITPEERAELSELERQLDRHLDQVAPLPLNELRLLHSELLQDAEKAGVRSGK